jgi:hypothetical protein
MMIAIEIEWIVAVEMAAAAEEALSTSTTRNDDRASFSA